MNIYPGSNIKSRIPYRSKTPSLPWYWVLFFGLVFGYLSGLVHQAAQQHQKRTCETCIWETAE